jgi:small-conductance mechanosensitive channel
LPGLAIQIEKPFPRRTVGAVRRSRRPGDENHLARHQAADQDRQFLIVPNSVVSKEPVLNHSEPIVPTRIDVEIGASYNVPPNDVKRAMHEAMANSPLVMKAPEPQVIIKGFGASSIDYVAQFWIEDYAIDRTARDQVRTNLWYTFRRHNIEIPVSDSSAVRARRRADRTERHVAPPADHLASVKSVKTLSAEARQRWPTAASHHLFAAGERS